MREYNTKEQIKNLDVIAPSLGRRFSGINASMMAVIPEQEKLVNIAGLGFNLDGNKISKISFKNFLTKCWRDKYRIWHSRRNIDMLVGIILKYIFRYKLKLVFTSASQRNLSWLTKFYCRRMNEIIATTRSGEKFQASQVNVVYHGINTIRFNPNLELLQKTKNICFLSRIRTQKGAEDFVDAAILALPKHPEWKAVLYGETTKGNIDFEKDLRNRITKAGLSERILFKGFVNYENTPECYRNADITVCPSHVEGFGLPCIEAMASGCAVVATKTGVWKEIIKNASNGYLVDVKSPDQIAEKLDILMSDDNNRQEVANNGYELVIKNFTIQKEAQGIQAVYYNMSASKKL